MKAAERVKKAHSAAFAQKAASNINLCANFLKSCTQPYNFYLFWHPLVEGARSACSRDAEVRIIQSINFIKRPDQSIV